MKKRAARKTFGRIRYIILSAFKDKQLTAYEISKITGIYWPTVRNHLIYLKGTDMIKEVFRHNRLKVFGLTEEGKNYLKRGKK